MSDTLKQSTDSKLIATAKVEGTAVFDLRGEKIGMIKDVYVDKRSGQVEYVAMATGGVFGVGEKHHRLPWAALSYDSGLNGYLVALDRAALSAAPVFADDQFGGDEADWKREVSDYYGRVSPQPGGAAKLDDHAVHLPHARKIDPPKDDEKTDHLAEKVEQAENRQEALLDEGVEESFPASDPVSVKRIT